MQLRNKWVIIAGSGVFFLGLVLRQITITDPVKTIDALNAKIWALSSESEELSENILRTRYLPCLKSMENMFLSSSSNEEKLLNLAGSCHIFSNALINFAKKSIKQKQYVKNKVLILQISNRIAKLIQSIYEAMPDKTDTPEISTPWLSVTYNDNYLNILDIIYSITFDKSCDSVQNIQKMLDKIVARLDENADPNIYANIVEEIEFDNTELIKAFFEKLSKACCYKTEITQTFSPKIQKFINHIKEYVTRAN